MLIKYKSNIMFGLTEATGKPVKALELQKQRTKKLPKH